MAERWAACWAEQLVGTMVACSVASWAACWADQMGAPSVARRVAWKAENWASQRVVQSAVELAGHWVARSVASSAGWTVASTAWMKAAQWAECSVGRLAGRSAA